MNKNTPFNILAEEKILEDEIVEECTRLFSKMNGTLNRYDYEH